MQSLIKLLQQLKLSIRYKIGLAFGLVIFLFIINGLISTYLLVNIDQNEARQRSVETYFEQIQRYKAAYNVQLNTYSDAVFLTHSTFFRNDFTDMSIVNQMAKDTFGADAVTEVFRKKIGSLYIPVVDHFLELEKYIHTGDFDTGKKKWLEFTPDFDRVSQTIDDRAKELVAEQEQGKNNLRQTINISLISIGGLTGFSLLFGLFSLFMISGVLVKPLKQLQQGLKEVAEGKLDQRLVIINEDEIGQLALSFRQAIQSLQQVIYGVQIGESLHNLTLQISAVSRQQAEGAAHQVISLEEVQETIVELSNTANEIAGRAVTVANLTDLTKEQIESVAQAGQISHQRARQMIVILENTVTGIEQIGQQVNEFNRVMVELNSQAEAISKVVNLLDSIADEVHMLALNASIEAVGAGEHGERFQVVAREIKQLASRANRANQEAHTLISAVQNSSRYALARFGQDQASVLSLVESNSDLRFSLHELDSSIAQVSTVVAQLQTLAGRVSEQADDIRLATHQQSVSSQLVIESAQAASAVAQQTTQTSHNLSQSSLTLETLTEQLNGVLSQVRLAR